MTINRSADNKEARFKEAAMFDSKGTCQYCSKPTRAKATSICNACYKLDLAIKNNPTAAQKIIKNYIPEPIMNDPIQPWGYDKVINPYSGTRPKEEQ
tara:strand:- start:529 stop:819 length:291 start_codon:yes stop_codon:yes gene_type:complete